MRSAPRIRSRRKTAVHKYAAAATTLCAALATQGAPPGGAVPQDWTIAHVGAAHCARWEMRDPQRGAWRGAVSCEWPGDGPGWNRLAAWCEGGKGGAAKRTEGQHAMATALAAGQTVPAVQKDVFDTERALLADYVAVCEGRKAKRRALVLAGDPDTAWTEHATGRPSGCRWLNLVATRSTMAGPNTEHPVAFTARAGGRGGVPAPVILAECCTGEPDGPPAQPLFASLHVDAFAEDPDPYSVLNPAHWMHAAGWSLRGGRFYEEEITLTYRTPGKELVMEQRVTMRREAVTWSTPQGYKGILDAGRFAQAFAEGGEVHVEIAPTGRKRGLRGEGVFVTGERTRQFLAACRRAG